MIKVDYAHLATLTEPDAQLAYLQELDSRQYGYDGLVKAKERPRMAKNGRVFTPKETRTFEKAVENWAKRLKAPVVKYPIRVTLLIYEPRPKSVAVPCGVLHYNQKGDIDNLAKSILDGLNGVLYADDKQIVDLGIKRRYGDPAGFDISIERAGLTAAEFANYCKRVAKA